MIIILILIIFIIVLYAVITPLYITDFIYGKNVVLEGIRAKSVYVDAIQYRKGYIVSLSPSVQNDVPAPLNDPALSPGVWSSGLQGFAGTYIFNNNQQDTLTFHVKPPTGWQSGTPTSVRLHFAPNNNTAGLLDLRLWYKKASVGGVFPTDYATVRINKDIFLNSSNMHLTAIFPSVDLTGESEQTSILFALERQANGGDSTDTFAGDIFILEIEVLFQVNKPGLTV